MDAISKLSEYFESFPGIGPRQAKRFVYFLVTRDSRFLKEFARHIEALREARAVCGSCYRHFAKGASAQSNSLCAICRDPNRSRETLMVVAKEADAENIERSGVFGGRYFILGGHLSLLSKESSREPVRARAYSATERLPKLVQTVDEQSGDGLKEVILAFAVNPEGEHTTYQVTELLTPLGKEKGFRVTTLGRGLSTGIELEYPDSETIKNALHNRR